MIEWTMDLGDGRKLGAAEYGDPDGQPVFLFHGQPGNRLFHPDVEQTRRSGVRLIVPDRPGYGLSTFEPGRKLLDWPGDVAALADHLELERFDVIGFSGGGPYALACASAIPGRLGRVIAAAGAPPMAAAELRRQMKWMPRLNYLLANHAKSLNRAAFRLFWGQARKNPARFVEMMAGQSPQVDREVIFHPVAGGMLRAVWEENLRVDPSGYVLDAEILMAPWGFDLEAVEKRVLLLWGRHDANVPVEVMAYFAKRLPQSTARVLPDAGHFLLLTCWETVLSILTGENHEQP